MQLVAVDHRPVRFDREALEREAADSLLLHEMERIARRPGSAIGDVDHGRDVHRVEELVEAAGRSGFLGDDDGAPGCSSHGVAGTEAGHDRRRVAGCGLGQVDALHGRIRRLFIADEKVLGMIVVGPHRDLVGCRCDAAGHERHMQAGGHLNGHQVVRSVVWAERALLDRMPDAEELFRVLAQLVGNERAEVAVRMVCDHSGRHPDDRNAGDKNTSADQRYAHGAFLLSSPQGRGG